MADQPMANSAGRRAAIPRWLGGLIGALPGLAVLVALLVMASTGHNQIFNLSPRDTFLVVGLIAVLTGLVLALLTICVVLIRAMGKPETGADPGIGAGRSSA
jgi:hypothetical protein